MNGSIGADLGSPQGRITKNVLTSTSFVVTWIMVRQFINMA